MSWVYPGHSCSYHLHGACLLRRSWIPFERSQSPTGCLQRCCNKVMTGEAIQSFKRGEKRTAPHQMVRSNNITVFPLRPKWKAERVFTRPVSNIIAERSEAIIYHRLLDLCTLDEAIETYAFSLTPPILSISPSPPPIKVEVI